MNWISIRPVEHLRLWFTLFKKDGLVAKNFLFCLRIVQVLGTTHLPDKTGIVQIGLMQNPNYSMSFLISS